MSDEPATDAAEARAEKAKLEAFAADRVAFETSASGVRIRELEKQRDELRAALQFVLDNPHKPGCLCAKHEAARRLLEKQG